MVEKNIYFSIIISVILMTAFGTLINSNISEINSNVSEINSNASDDIFDSELMKIAAGIPPVEWNNTWGGSEDERAEGIALDSSGNAFLAGCIGSFAVGDWCLVNFNSTGDFNWSSTWGGSGYEEAEGIALDSAGNAYVVGFTYGFGAGGQMCLVKFNSTGDFEWYSLWGGSGDEAGIAIALDSSGNAYVAGLTSTYGAGSNDVCLVKFNSTGDVEWFGTWGGSGFDGGYAIALDSSGNAYVAGETNSYGAGNNDVCLVKFNSTGDVEDYGLWGGSEDEAGVSMVLDLSGNILVTGRTESYGAGNKDMCLVKFNPSGAVEGYSLWGGSEDDAGYGIALDSSGNALVAGGTKSLGAVIEDICLVKFTIDTGSPGGGALAPAAGDDDDDDDDGNEMDPSFIYIIVGVISGAGIVTVVSIIHFKKRKLKKNRE